MTVTSHASAPAPPGPASDDVRLVADTFVGLMRSFTRARARLMAAAQHDVEWSAHVLLKTLSTEGPMRAGALAESVHSDPSTVSRQVAALVKEGLVERRADPVDGRASLLVVTPKADSVLAEHNEIRLAHFTRMLSSWSERDLRRFASLLERFTDDYNRANHDWLTERADDHSARTEGND